MIQGVTKYSRQYDMEYTVQYGIVLICTLSLQVCLFFCIAYLKSAPQLEHLYGFSPVWHLICCLTLPISVFLYSQCLPLMGSISCLSMCFLWSPSWLNELSQDFLVQEKCRLSCTFSWKSLWDLNGQNFVTSATIEGTQFVYVAVFFEWKRADKFFVTHYAV